MSGPGSDALRRAGRRALKRAGRPITVHTAQIERDAEDEPVFDDQGDPVFTEPTNVETVGEIRLRGSTALELSDAGASADVDAQIYLLDPLLDDTDTEVEITSGGNDITEPATEITVPDSGRYRVTHVHAEAGGRQRCACERL